MKYTFNNLLICYTYSEVLLTQMKPDMLSTAIKKKLVLSGISYAVSIYIIILLLGFNESTFQNSQYKESFSHICGYM
jgi:hypothetical protein